MMAVKEGQITTVNTLVEGLADVDIQEIVRMLWTVHCMRIYWEIFGHGYICLIISVIEKVYIESGQ